MASCWRANDSQDSARANVTIRRPASFACQDAFCRVHAVALRIVHGQLPIAPRPVSDLTFADLIASVQN
jgi:hypothetical protein